MDFLLAIITAMAVSLVIIPVMVRVAPALGMLDRPNARKVHHHPIPRVGGWGIVIGAAIALVSWVPLTPVALAFLFGAAVLLLVGALDDSRDLRPLLKLALQIAVSVPVLFYADLGIERLTLPFAGDVVLPSFIALALSAFGLLAIINATNTSDGLDGLAGGETLLSLVGILYLAYATANTEVLTITAATAGGLFGFLRYNTHPAAIFMGDAGSQFLGFAVGVLTLALLQAESGNLSIWLILLLAGLPPIDLAVVAVRRILRGANCFHADRTHLHHRLLDLGFSHTQCVLIFYSLQGSLVMSAMVLRDSGDGPLSAIYLAHIAVIYGLLHWAERSDRFRAALLAYRRNVATRSQSRTRLLVWAPRALMEFTVGATLVVCAIVARDVPPDFGLLAGILLVPLAATALLNSRPRSFLTRIPTYLTAAAVLFLYTEGRPLPRAQLLWVELTVASLIAVCLIAAMRFSPQRRNSEFRATAMDYLILLVAVACMVTPLSMLSWLDARFFLYLSIMLYACELTLVERRERPDWLFSGTVAAAVIMAIRSIS